jgi:phosphoglucomutase
MNDRAGTPALESDLIDVDEVVSAYYDRVPDMTSPAQHVVFGTSGHRGSSLDGSFNDAHIAAATQAIVEYRTTQGFTGPLFLGRDTHALSRPAETTALEVLVANGVEVLTDARDGVVPTPALSRAIVSHNAGRPGGLADGIVVTPSHNPPRDGGFKYNPPHGGPADTDATRWIAKRANDILRAGSTDVKRQPNAAGGRYDFRERYVSDLGDAIDVQAIANAGVRIGADPLGGASVEYWALLGERFGLDLTVVNPTVDPTWRFMTLDWDGKIRMDPSSAFAMASVLTRRKDFDVLVGNDADGDRHGIVTPDRGLMNPNHYLAVAVQYLFRHRPQWRPDAAVGKTLVSSSMIDRVAVTVGRALWEVPVGFKWFVPGLGDGSVGFGGEESAGASFLTRDGATWTTDKDGILLGLLAAEILAVTQKSPSDLYGELTATLGEPTYERVDAPATKEQKAHLAKLSAADIRATELAGEPIIAIYTEAPGNGAPIGGLKVVSESAWFAARPSGTEDVYKIYAESFRGPAHLADVQATARSVVEAALER